MRQQAAVGAAFVVGVVVVLTLVSPQNETRQPAAPARSPVAAEEPEAVPLRGMKLMLKRIEEMARLARTHEDESPMQMTIIEGIAKEANAVITTPAPLPPPAPPAVAVPADAAPAFHALWSRPTFFQSHVALTKPHHVDYIDAYHNVSDVRGKSTVLFAHRKADCVDWNKEHPSELFIGNVMGAIRASIPRGGLAIDIGACYGDTAVPIAAIIADRVIAYEPNPASFDVLKYNALLNPGLNIKPYKLAAAGDETTKSLEFTYSGTMCNGGMNFGLEHQKTETKLTVAATHVPTHLAENYGEDIYDAITFIKIDTEGFEHSILPTLKPILQRNPKIILMAEWFDWYVTGKAPLNTFEPTTAGVPPEGVHPKAKALFDAVDELGYDAYEPYSMKFIPGPQNKYKVPDITLLPKGTKPWKPYSFPR